MALDKLVDSTQLDANLASVANAIRTKGGTSASLAFPQGFVDAVDAIQTGGGDPKSIMRSRLNGSITEYEDNELTTVVDAAFNQCTKLTSLRLHGLTKLAASWLGNIAVTALAFPNVTSGWANYSFNGAKKLKAVDFSKIPKVVSNGFNGTSVMDTLVLRNSTVVPLENINAFNSTKFKDGSTGGTLYVPSALISSYQSETNWSTILGYANNQILPIEGSIYETQYADGTPIPTT